MRTALRCLKQCVRGVNVFGFNVIAYHVYYGIVMLR